MIQIFDKLKELTKGLSYDLCLPGRKPIPIIETTDMLKVIDRAKSSYLSQSKKNEDEVRNKAIDEFAEEMKRWVCINYGLSDVELEEIEEMAQRLKSESTPSVTYSSAELHERE